MKRIQYACVEQTSRFETEDDYMHYLKVMDKKKTKYKVISADKQPDNSVIVKTKIQYLNYETGNYMD